MRTRTRTARPSEVSLRRMLREFGFFKVEAVPWIRQQDGAHTAIVCWPAEETAKAVTLLLNPANKFLEITKIHIGRVTCPGQPPEVRVYIKWAH